MQIDGEANTTDLYIQLENKFFFCLHKSFCSEYNSLTLQLEQIESGQIG